MFLSIIIPVYNAEKYLRECLDSCLNQDISSDKYEIICVNDGSTDNSAAVLSEYKELYSNVKVIHKPNGGVSSARNMGIEAACGDYIWFVDSDDFVQENILSELFDFSQKNDCDRIMFHHYEFVEKLTDEQVSLKHRRLLEHNATSAGYVICTSLFHRALIHSHHIRFRTNIYYAEDGLFCYEYSRVSRNSSVYNELLYFYRRNDFSATRTHNKQANEKRTQSAYNCALVMMEYMIQDKNKFTDLYADEAVAVLMPGIRSITSSAARLPKNLRTSVIKELQQNKLFPLFLYRKPRDWFPKSIHLNMAYKGFKGIVFDTLNFYSTTRFGFSILCLVNSLYRR